MLRARLLAMCALTASAHSSVSSSPSLSRLIVADDRELQLEQEFTGAEEGSVLWDCSRSFLAFLQSCKGDVLNKRIIEIGSGTGAVGLALARMGAKSVVITDKASQLPLMRRNLEHNQPECCASQCALCDWIAPVRVEMLTWGHDWKAEASPAVAEADSFDIIVCCDCVYPSVSPDPLIHVLLDLLHLNPNAVCLLACEYRPPTAGVQPGVDHVRDFFQRMRAKCAVSQVPTEDLPPQWRCDEISMWRIQSLAQA